jgi:hypothetical protein
VDAVCDKAFVVPCWISLLSTVPASGYLRITQCFVLWCLILAETASGCIRFRAFFTASGIPAPTVEGLDFSTSAVKVKSSLVGCFGIYSDHLTLSIYLEHNF